jgi:MFS family permease
MSGAMMYKKDGLKIKEEIFAGLIILDICAPFIGSIAAGRTSDYIGRRYTIFLACILFLLGAILEGYGPSYAIIKTGRCIAGIGAGIAIVIAPVYAVEISSPSSRGFLTSPLLTLALASESYLAISQIILLQNRL